MSLSVEIEGVEISRGKVLPDWIDINGHMNVAYYVLAFDLAVDTLWLDFGLDNEHIRVNNSSTFAVESHVLYRKELLLNDPFIVTSQILAFDEKRIHQFQRMYHASEGYLAASAEWMNLHVDMKTRRVSPWPAQVLRAMRRVAASQGTWPYPADAGRSMRIREPLFSIAGAC
ncbi:MAG: thioesterase family protein [Gammaproteobacteria bacterium]|nr:thioesterase family protein [Gammaproteobacteria bacterium]MDH5302518.1 thioesterase family protein [Gammaproteobacteria bacterium]MDH5322302.1 thioesterase family protein [Gammaproteobacteria bacterium]